MKVQSEICKTYRVNHKGKHCKDDLNFLKYDEFKVNLSCREPIILGHMLYTFRTIVSEVSFIVGNPVNKNLKLEITETKYIIFQFDPFISVKSNNNVEYPLSTVG